MSVECQAARLDIQTARIGPFRPGAAVIPHAVGPARVYTFEFFSNAIPFINNLNRIGDTVNGSKLAGFVDRHECIANLQCGRVHVTGGVARTPAGKLDRCAVLDDDIADKPSVTATANIDCSACDGLFAGRSMLGRERL